MDLVNLKEEYIREATGWRKEGVDFRDISPVFYESRAFTSVLNEALDLIDGDDFDVICGIGPLGGMLAAAAGAYTNAPIALIERTADRDPNAKINFLAVEGDTEGDTEHVVSVPDLAIKAGQQVIVFGGVLASGKTTLAAVNLIENIGAEVGRIIFVTEIEQLNGRDRLSGYDVTSFSAY